MNIYFACSITGGREFEAIYQTITQTLLESGHEVPTAHLAESSVIKMEKVVGANEIYSRDVTWIQACNALIAEVSTPSHGVGYEVAYALGLGKPVLCCYQFRMQVSKMITGNPDKNLKVVSYRDAYQVVELVHKFMNELQKGL
jgi:nucleoside 2-deoxyribosyltransferase